MRLGGWDVDFRSPGSHFIKGRDWVVIKEGFHKEPLKSKPSIASAIIWTAPRVHL